MSHDEMITGDALVRAAEKGDIEVIKLHIASGANVRYKHDLALRRAAVYGQNETIKFLKELGSDIHALNEDALWSAITCGQIETINLLLKMGADPFVRKGDFFLKSAELGKMESLRALLDFSRVDSATMDSMLSVAAYNGRLDVVKMLVQRGSDPFGANHSALNLAEVDDHQVVIAYLKETRAAELAVFLKDMNEAADLKTWLRKPYGKTGEVPLIRACKMRCLDKVGEKMMAAGDGLTLADLSEFKEHEGQSNLLQLASGDFQCRNIFRPELWRGRFDDMQSAWLTIPEADRKLYKDFDKFDFTSVVEEYRQMVLRQNRPKITLKGPKA